MPPKSKKSVAAPTASNPAKEDVSMTDAPATPSPPPQPAAEHHSFLEQQRIRILPGSSETAASFEFTDEDHTLGNAIRYIIMKNPEVEFCGYSIPHPSEPKMNLRIQTYEGYTAFEALEKGFDDLMDLCDVVADKFASARADFALNGPEVHIGTDDEDEYESQ